MCIKIICKKLNISTDLFRSRQYLNITITAATIMTVIVPTTPPTILSTFKSNA